MVNQRSKTSTFHTSNLKPQTSNFNLNHTKYGNLPFFCTVLLQPFQKVDWALRNVSKHCLRYAHKNATKTPLQQRPMIEAFEFIEHINWLFYGKQMCLHVIFCFFFAKTQRNNKTTGKTLWLLSLLFATITNKICIQLFDHTAQKTTGFHYTMCHWLLFVFTFSTVMFTTPCLGSVFFFVCH